MSSEPRSRHGPSTRGGRPQRRATTSYATSSSQARSPPASPGSKRGRPFGAPAAVPRNRARSSRPVPPSGRPLGRCGRRVIGLEGEAGRREQHASSVPPGCDSASPAASTLSRAWPPLSSWPHRPATPPSTSSSDSSSWPCWCSVVIVIVWAVRHDMAGRTAWRERRGGGAGVAPPTRGTVSADAPEASVEAATERAAWTRRLWARWSATADRVAGGARAHRVRPGRWGQSRRGADRHAGRVGAPGYPGRPGVRRLGRGDQRSGLRQRPDP